MLAGTFLLVSLLFSNTLTMIPPLPPTPCEQQIGLTGEMEGPYPTQIANAFPNDAQGRPPVTSGPRGNLRCRCETPLWAFCRIEVHPGAQEDAVRQKLNPLDPQNMRPFFIHRTYEEDHVVYANMHCPPIVYAALNLHLYISPSQLSPRNSRLPPFETRPRSDAISESGPSSSQAGPSSQAGTSSQPGPSSQAGTSSQPGPSSQAGPSQAGPSSQLQNARSRSISRQNILLRLWRGVRRRPGPQGISSQRNWQGQNSPTTAPQNLNGTPLDRSVRPLWGRRRPINIPPERRPPMPMEEPEEDAEEDHFFPSLQYIRLYQCTHNSEETICPITLQSFEENDIVFVLKKDARKARNGEHVVCISAHGLTMLANTEDSQDWLGFKEPLNRITGRRVTLVRDYDAYAIVNDTCELHAGESSSHASASELAAIFQHLSTQDEPGPSREEDNPDSGEERYPHLNPDFDIVNTSNFQTHPFYKIILPFTFITSLSFYLCISTKSTSEVYVEFHDNF